MGHRWPAGGAVEERCGSDVTKLIAFLVVVLRWRYGGLYPPPFRLVLHIAGGGAVGRTLNKQSNTLPMLLASVYFAGCVRNCTNALGLLCTLLST